MKSTDPVIYDHANLQRGLRILDGMVRKLEEGDRIEIADVVSILKFLRLFGEQSEHSEERRLVTQIEGALQRKVGSDFVHSSRRLTVLLRSRLDKQDTVLRSDTSLNLSRLERKYTSKHETPRARGAVG
jgi:hemerythrin-like domain-containing protein